MPKPIIIGNNHKVGMATAWKDLEFAVIYRWVHDGKNYTLERQLYMGGGPGTGQNPHVKDADWDDKNVKEPTSYDFRLIQEGSGTCVYYQAGGGWEKVCW